MKVLGFVVLFVFALAAIVLLCGQLGLLSGSAPSDLGVQNGRLKPPALTPNSVSSQSDLYPDNPQHSKAQIAPLAYQGDPSAALQRLLAILQQSQGVVLVTQHPDYLYAQCSTPWLKFTDDLEFWLKPDEGVIHVRSASRLGKSDLGANRARVEKIRAQFQSN